MTDILLLILASGVILLAVEYRPRRGDCLGLQTEKVRDMSDQQAKKEKELADNAHLLRAWKKFHREEREAALAGPYGATLTELFRMFANMQHVRPSHLVGYTRAIEWSEIDYPTRLTVLHEANAAITKLREQQGLPPVDDALPGEQSRAFQIIREIISFPHKRGGPLGHPANHKVRSKSDE